MITFYIIQHIFKHWKHNVQSFRTYKKIPHRFEFLPATGIKKVHQLRFQIIMWLGSFKNIRPWIKCVIGPIVSANQLFGCKFGWLIDYMPGIIQIPIMGKNTIFRFQSLVLTSTRIGRKNMISGSSNALFYTPIHRSFKYIASSSSNPNTKLPLIIIPKSCNRFTADA